MKSYDGLCFQALEFAIKGMHDCKGRVCEPLYGAADPQMTCVPPPPPYFPHFGDHFGVTVTRHSTLGTELFVVLSMRSIDAVLQAIMCKNHACFFVWQMPVYIPNPDCSIFAHLQGTILMHSLISVRAAAVTRSLRGTPPARPANGTISFDTIFHWRTPSTARHTRTPTHTHTHACTPTRLQVPARMHTQLSSVCEKKIALPRMGRSTRPIWTDILNTHGRC